MAGLEEGYEAEAIRFRTQVSARIEDSYARQDEKDRWNDHLP